MLFYSSENMYTNCVQCECYELTTYGINAIIQINLKLRTVVHFALILYSILNEIVKIDRKCLETRKRVYIDLQSDL